MPDNKSVNDLIKECRALEWVEKATLERMATIKNEREEREVNRLIERAFQPRCEWEKKNMTGLLTLALKPDEAGCYFKLRERFHHLVHRD
jgi:hypothetical protein